MTDSAERLLYLYGIVPADADEPPAELRGLEGAPVFLLRTAEVAAVLSELPAAGYADEPLNQRLSDLAWVGERGLAHERVVDWYAERGPVLPLSLFSLHQDRERIRARLDADAARYTERLGQLRGRREWGVKLWRRDAQLAEHLDELSPLLRALREEIDRSPPGRRFLLSKKREAAQADELRAVARRAAHQVFSALQDEAVQATTMSLPASAGESERVLSLHAAFLVADEAFPAFQQRLSLLARELGGVGFEFEFTGPWPPYHFAELDAA